MTSVYKTKQHEHNQQTDLLSSSRQRVAKEPDDDDDDNDDAATAACRCGWRGNPFAVSWLPTTRGGRPCG